MPQPDLTPLHARSGKAPLLSPKASEVKQHLCELARKFYAAHGYLVPSGYDFSKATHPQECLMWRLALIAWEHERGDEPDPQDLED